MARLKKQPDIRIETVAELVGIARAIGVEATRRYHWLAGEMRRRGQASTAEAFDALADEENNHTSAVESWARNLGETAPAGDFCGRLPQDLVGHWKEASRSALLTPYRAYSIAVDNEARGFAFYAYLAASVDDSRIAREAEHLALEKLRHAASLRTLRRAAWHSDSYVRRSQRRTTYISSAAELETIIAAHEAEIARCHRTLAKRLLNLDDAEGAGLLTRLAATARDRAGAARADNSVTESCTLDHPLGLLLAAQVPLEQLCEALDSVLLTASDETTRMLAERAVESAVDRIAQLGRHTEKLECL